jgi:hypothetical protein
MFMYTMTYLQVMPGFLELVFPFGRQHNIRDFHFSALNSENRLTSAARGLEVRQLNRSGRHVEICYGLKAVERTPDVNPWSIRQCSVYHKFDLETAQATWIIVKGDSLMQDLVTKHTLRERGYDTERYGQERCAFSDSLDVHALIAAWAGENWQWYINDLETSFQDLTRPLLTTSFNNATPKLPPLPEDGSCPTAHLPPPPTKRWTFRRISSSAKRSLSWSTVKSESTLVHPEKQPYLSTPQSHPTTAVSMNGFALRDLPKVQSIQEKANELLLVISANAAILEKLQENYQTVFATPQTPTIVGQDAAIAFEKFIRNLDDVRSRIAMQRTRVETLMYLVNERKSLVSMFCTH